MLSRTGCTRRNTESSTRHIAITSWSSSRSACFTGGSRCSSRAICTTTAATATAAIITRSSPAAAGHAVAHLAAVFFLGWGAAYLVGRWHLPLAPHLVAIGGLVFAAGWIVGPALLGLYLLVSLNVFGRHHNEAFSSLAIADWKNF